MRRIGSRIPRLLIHVVIMLARKTIFSFDSNLGARPGVDALKETASATVSIPENGVSRPQAYPRIADSDPVGQISRLIFLT